MKLNAKSTALELYTKGVSDTEISEYVCVELRIVEKWIKDFKYLELIKPPSKKLIYIKDLEDELFVLLNKEARGEANQLEKKLSLSIQKTYTQYDALNLEIRI